MKDSIISRIKYVFRADEIHKEVIKTQNKVQEVLWRGVFRDTVEGFEWYNVDSISPGRWAVGYNYLYALVRVIDAIKPKTILEMGLGQSSKVLASYVKASSQVTYYDIVEQDKTWVKFFLKDCILPSSVAVHIRNIITSEYCGLPYYYYEDFDSIVAGKKYHLISIDGPWGGDALSRADIVKYVPNCLEKEFVILVDDWERPGEQLMTAQIEEALRTAKIEFATGNYCGEKDVHLICSKSLQFLTTL